MEMTLPPIVRRAEASDAAALAKLAATTFTETFGRLYSPEDLTAFLATARSEERYRRMFSEPRTALWVAAERNGELIGYVLAGLCKLPVQNLAPQAGEIKELYLLSAHQGRQIGTRLLTTALEWLEAEEFSPLYLGVWSENLGAQRLYGRFGFDKVGEYDFPVGKHVDREFILIRR